jgi:hypothetical protein
VPLHICESEVPPRVAVRELLVIQPEQVQDRGVEVVDVLRRVEAEVVGGTIARSGFGAAAGSA